MHEPAASMCMHATATCTVAGSVTEHAAAVTATLVTKAFAVQCSKHHPYASPPAISGSSEKGYKAGIPG
jgi:hypothetical protein